MGKYSFDMTVGELLKDPKTRSVFERHVPNLLHHPMLGLAKNMRLNNLVQLNNGFIPDETVKKIKLELESIE